MAGKDGKLESKGRDVIRQGFMIKRSQNKKRFTPVNYKQRWFVLTKHYLIYYDGDGEVSNFGLYEYIQILPSMIKFRTKSNSMCIRDRLVSSFAKYYASKTQMCPVNGS